MAAIDKLIVTNALALRTKYGATGWRRVRAAVGRLVEADRRRGLALANPVRRRQVTLLLRPTLEFLRRCGWPLRSRWLAPAGVDAS